MRVCRETNKLRGCVLPSVDKCIDSSWGAQVSWAVHSRNSQIPIVSQAEYVKWQGEGGGKVRKCNMGIIECVTHMSRVDAVGRNITLWGLNMQAPLAVLRSHCSSSVYRRCVCVCVCVCVASLIPWNLMKWNKLMSFCVRAPRACLCWCSSAEDMHLLRNCQSVCQSLIAIIHYKRLRKLLETWFQC